MKPGSGEQRLTLANGLTAFRLVVAAPGFLACAVLGAREVFLWLLVASFASDAVDGTVARLTGGPTRFGARLDSWADAVAYSTIALGVALLWPEVVMRERAACLALVASFSVPALAGRVRFGRFTSYHTWLTKLAVATTALCLVAALADGPAWPLRIAATLAVLAAAEELAITCLLAAPRSNVRGLWALRRSVRGRSTGRS